ncbi:MAG: NAD(P)/FAD-dependent oxidoreductase [Beijerinckiaceae bacterium]
MSGGVHDIAVVGGGLHGLSAALNLARAGLRVVILEKSWVGRHASSSTAAGVRTLGRAVEEIPIALEAMDMWHGIEGIVGDDCGFHADGQLRVAEYDRHMPDLQQREALMRSLGYMHEEIIDRDELRQLVPALAQHCVGALVSRRDGAADPHRTIAAYRRSCEAAGVTIREGAGVLGVERRGGVWVLRIDSGSVEAPVVVNAAGAWAGQLAALFGDAIPLGLKASMMIVTERLAPLLRPVVSVVGRTLSFKQSDQGTLVIGGGLQGSADLDRQQSRVDFVTLAKGARAATDLFPAVGTVRIARSWAGIEAKTADLLPVIEASPQVEGLFHAFGFSGHGFELVPVVGAIIRDLVVDGGTNRVIGAFGADRLRPARAAA